MIEARDEDVTAFELWWERDCDPQFAKEFGYKSHMYEALRSMAMLAWAVSANVARRDEVVP